MPIRYFVLCLDVPQATAEQLEDIGEALIGSHWTKVDANLFVVSALPDVGDDQAEASARAVLARHGVDRATFSVADLTSTRVAGRTCSVP